MVPYIDAHQHFWNLEQEFYPWLTPTLAPIYRSFGPADLAPQLEACGIIGTVLVQSANSFDDTRVMLEQAQSVPWVLGVVGWLPLTEPRILERALEVYGDNPHLKGVRHLNHDEPNPDYLLRPGVLESLKLLAQRGLTLDLIAVLPRHLEHAVTLARHCPDLRLVIDHLAKPPIRGGGWEPWASGLARAAQPPNVYAKVSGLNTAANWAGWSAHDLERYVTHALEHFGANRLMFGSDWPVALLAGDYSKVWTESRALLEALSSDEKAQVLGATAAAFYHLEVPGA